MSETSKLLAVVGEYEVVDAFGFLDDRTRIIWTKGRSNYRFGAADVYYNKKRQQLMCQIYLKGGGGFNEDFIDAVKIAFQEAKKIDA